MSIYHIVLPEVWENFKDKEEYEAASLATEGFIHGSFETQIAGVLERYYKEAERVLILQLDPEKLTSELINEPSTNDEVYPHIYGKINKSAIIGIEDRFLK